QPSVVFLFLHFFLLSLPTSSTFFPYTTLFRSINYGVMGFTPSFLIREYGLDQATTGLQFGLLAAALGVLGPVIAGPLSDFLTTKDRKSTRLNSSHVKISYAVFCLKKQNQQKDC